MCWLGKPAGVLLEHEPFDSVLKCRVILLGVDGRRVEAFVAENLGEPRQVIAGLIEIPMGERMPKGVRCERYSADRGILVAYGSNAFIGQGSAFTDEDAVGIDRWSFLQVRSQQSPGS